MALLEAQRDALVAENQSRQHDLNCIYQDQTGLSGVVQRCTLYAGCDQDRAAVNGVAFVRMR
eukprot:968582-Amphidinium_carterae.2